MEQYDHFCTVSRFLYHELEIAATMAHSLAIGGLDNQYWLGQKEILLRKIEIHLHAFERVMFEKEKGF